MKKFKLLRNICIVIILIMCIDVAFNYARMLCGISHMGFSAPAKVAFYIAIPYSIGIIICAVLAIVFHKKQSNN